MLQDIKKVQDLYIAEKNPVRYMFRLIGIRVASTHGFHSTSTVGFRLDSGSIRNTLISNKVVKYTTKTNRRGEKYQALGLTQKGWDMFMSDAMKYGYCVPPMIWDAKTHSDLDDLQESPTYTGLTRELANIEIALQHIANQKTNEALKEKQKLNDRKMAVLTDIHELNVAYQQRQEARNQVATANA